MHLEIFTDRRRKNPYVYGLFRETFRQDGRVCHRTRGRVTGLTLGQLEAFRDFVRHGYPSGIGYPVRNSREFGAVFAVLRMAESLGLDRLLYSRREPWVRQNAHRRALPDSLHAHAVCGQGPRRSGDEAGLAFGTRATET